MDFAHIHIVLNHVPSLGSLLALGLLIGAIYKSDIALKKFSFEILVFVALAALPTYLSGNPARKQLGDRPAVSAPMIEKHQDAAMLTLAAITIAGTFAWFGLWEFRRYSGISRLTSMGALLSTGVSAAAILYTAGLGGKISHPEIRDGADAAIAAGPSLRAKVEEYMSVAWAWPTAETLHFVGMVLLFGVSLLLMLRMMGFMKSVPFSGIHRLFPVAMLGFVINVFTGMVFYIALPGNYVGKTGFLLKIGCILLAALPVFYFTVFEDPWKTGSNVNASALSRIAAVSTFLLLVGVMIFGRLLPFFN